MLFKKIYTMTIYLFVFSIILLGIFLTENSHRRNITRFVNISLEKEIQEVNQIELLGNQPELYSRSNLITIASFIKATEKLEKDSNEKVYTYFNEQLIGSTYDSNKAFSDFQVVAPSIYEMGYKINSDNALVISSKVLFSDLTFDRIKVIDITSFYQERISNYFVLIITAFAIIIITSVFYYRFSKKLIQPIDAIVNHLKTIGSGHYSTPLIVENSEDYENIVDAVNHMQEKVLEASNSLIEQNKRQSLFIRNMNHEIRTPITSIIGYSELMTNDKADEQIKKESAVFIKEEGLRLTKLSKKLSQIMMITDYQLDHQPFSSLELKKHLQSLYSHHSRVSDMTYIFKDVVITSDLDLLVMFYVNLIDNAIKATQPSQSITIQYDKKDNCHIFSVEDEGIGFEDTLLCTVYEPFVKGSYNKNESGTGLGLSICHKIASQLEGTLTIDPSREKGARITMTMEVIDYE